MPSTLTRLPFFAYCDPTSRSVSSSGRLPRCSECGSWNARCALDAESSPPEPRSNLERSWSTTGTKSPISRASLVLGAFSSPSPILPPNQTAVQGVCQLCRADLGSGAIRVPLPRVTGRHTHRRTDPRGRYARRGRSSGLSSARSRHLTGCRDRRSRSGTKSPFGVRVIRSRHGFGVARLARSRGSRRARHLRAARRIPYRWRSRGSPRPTPRLPDPGRVLGPRRGSEVRGRTARRRRSDRQGGRRRRREDPGHRSGLLQVR